MALIKQAIGRLRKKNDEVREDALGYGTDPQRDEKPGIKKPPDWRRFFGCVTQFDQNALLAEIPIFFRMIARGQKPVNEDWNKLKPTKAVKNNQYSWWKIGLAETPRARESMIMVPAKAIMMRSIDMTGTSIGLM